MCCGLPPFSFFALLMAREGRNPCEMAKYLNLRGQGLRIEGRGGHFCLALFRILEYNAELGRCIKKGRNKWVNLRKK